MALGVKFTKERLEQAILELLKDENYHHNIGETIYREQLKGVTHG